MPTLIDDRPANKSRFRMDWKSEWFDGRRRAFTHAETVELGFSGVERFRTSFLNAAQRAGKFGRSTKTREGVTVWVVNDPATPLERRPGRRGNRQTAVCPPPKKAQADTRESKKEEATQGVGIVPDGLYSLPAFRSITGLSESSMRLARRRGVELETYTVARRKFARGVDAIAYLDRVAALGRLVPAEGAAEDPSEPSVGQLLFRRNEAAAMLGISVRTLDQMLAEGQIRPTRVRGAVRLPLAELHRVAAEGLQP